MAKNIFSGWKKFSTNGKNTIMQHPSGHRMVLVHKNLRPEHLEQLHALPFHTNKEKSQSNPKLEQSRVRLADGGAVNQQQGGPEVAKKENYNKDQELIDSIQDPELQRTIEKEPRRQYAEGTPDQTIQAAADQLPQTVPTDVPQVSPEQQATREIYNHEVATPTGRGFMASPQKAFGPNGEAPEQFDASAYKDAQAKFNQQAQEQAASAQEQQAATIEENKARAAAGLAPLPTPVAQAAAEQDPKLQAQTAQAAAPKTADDPYGTQAYSDAFMKGLNEQKAGYGQEAAARGSMGDEQAQALHRQQETQQKALSDYQTHYQGLTDERNNLINDINNQHIDPQHYLGSMDTGSKIATAIGLIAGGIGAGMTHSQSAAAQFLNSQIDRDIAAQKANLGKSENLLSANMQQFHNVRDATEMTRVMMSDIVSNQLKMAAAKAEGPLAKAQLLQHAGQLDQQAAPVLAQIAMRKTLLSGMNSGHIAPEQVIRAIVPEKEQGAYYKELKEAQDMSSARDNALSGLDQLAKLNTAGNRIAHPFDSTRQINAIKGAVIPALSKASAGRFTEEDAKYVDHLFDTLGSGPEAIATARRELDKLVSEKMHFPMIKSIGIDANQLGRFGRSGGQSRFQLGPVKQ